MCLSERRHHHRGPLLSFTVAAEVEADAVVGRSSETHLMAAGGFNLILHWTQVKLCNELQAKKEMNFMQKKKWIKLYGIIKNTIKYGTAVQEILFVTEWEARVCRQFKWVNYMWTYLVI